MFSDEEWTSIHRHFYQPTHIIFPMESSSRSITESGSVEIDAFSEDNRIIVGEELFKEFCWAWIETKGPSILKAVIRENEVKERKKGKATLSRSNATIMDQII